jgi:hypothetical protein
LEAFSCRKKAANIATLLLYPVVLSVKLLRNQEVRCPKLASSVAAADQRAGKVTIVTVRIKENIQDARVKNADH